MFSGLVSATLEKTIEKLLIVGFVLFFCAFFLSADRALVKQVATLLIALPVMALLIFRIKSMLPLIRRNAFLLILVFFLWIFAAFFINSGMDEALRKLKHFALNGLYILAVFFIFNNRKTVSPMILTVVGVSSSISVLIILYCVINQTGVGYFKHPDTGAIRFSGLGALYLPISSAYVYASLLMYLCIAWIEGVFDSRALRYINIVNILMALIFLVGSGTRAALVSLVFILFRPENLLSAYCG
jgi:hypothetical protein